jgi:hypothetical protein
VLRLPALLLPLLPVIKPLANVAIKNVAAVRVLPAKPLAPTAAKKGAITAKAANKVATSARDANPLPVPIVASKAVISAINANRAAISVKDANPAANIMAAKNAT